MCCELKETNLDHGRFVSEISFWMMKRMKLDFEVFACVCFYVRVYNYSYSCKNKNFHARKRTQPIYRYPSEEPNGCSYVKLRRTQGYGKAMVV